MGKYRKLPVEIEAVQFRDVVRETGQPRFGEVPVPDWLQDALANDRRDVKVYDDHLLVRTKEGWLKANPRDWIIQGIVGELYPCKPDIFEQTYERVDA